MVSGMSDPRPPHPYYCHECGQHAPFRSPFLAIPHEAGCPRAGEDAIDVYYTALAWVLANGEEIP